MDSGKKQKDIGMYYQTKTTSSKTFTKRKNNLNLSVSKFKKNYYLHRNRNISYTRRKMIKKCASNKIVNISSEESSNTENNSDTGYSADIDQDIKFVTIRKKKLSKSRFSKIEALRNMRNLNFVSSCNIDKLHYIESECKDNEEFRHFKDVHNNENVFVLETSDPSKKVVDYDTIIVSASVSESEFDEDVEIPIQKQIVVDYKTIVSNFPLNDFLNSSNTVKNTIDDKQSTKYESQCKNKKNSTVPLDYNTSVSLFSDSSDIFLKQNKNGQNSNVLNNFPSYNDNAFMNTNNSVDSSNISICPNQEQEYQKHSDVQIQFNSNCSTPFFLLNDFLNSLNTAKSTVDDKQSTNYESQCKNKKNSADFVPLDYEPAVSLFSDRSDIFLEQNKTGQNLYVLNNVSTYPDNAFINTYNSVDNSNISICPNQEQEYKKHPSLLRQFDSNCLTTSLKEEKSVSEKIFDLFKNLSYPSCILSPEKKKSEKNESVLFGNSNFSQFSNEINKKNASIKLESILDCPEICLNEEQRQQKLPSSLHNNNSDMIIEYISDSSSIFYSNEDEDNRKKKSENVTRHDSQNSTSNNSDIIPIKKFGASVPIESLSDDSNSENNILPSMANRYFLRSTMKRKVVNNTSDSDKPKCIRKLKKLNFNS